MHARDILDFLTFIRGYPGLDTDNLVLIGHSCSAHMIASIAMNSAEPALVPAPAILSAIKAIVCSEGIYDLDALLATFPGYRAYFVAAAFGDNADYAKYNAAGWPLREGAQIEWLLLHSREDTLVDVGQAERMHAHLATLDPERVVLELDTVVGEHDDVLNSGEAYVARVCAFIKRFY